MRERNRLKKTRESGNVRDVFRLRVHSQTHIIYIVYTQPFTLSLRQHLPRHMTKRVQWEVFSNVFKVLWCAVRGRKETAEEWVPLISPDEHWLMLHNVSHITDTEEAVYVFHASILPRLIRGTESAKLTTTVAELLTPVEEGLIPNVYSHYSVRRKLMDIKWATDGRSGVLILAGTLRGSGSRTSILSV